MISGSLACIGYPSGNDKATMGQTARKGSATYAEIMAVSFDKGWRVRVSGFKLTTTIHGVQA